MPTRIAIIRKFLSVTSILKIKNKNFKRFYLFIYLFLEREGNINVWLPLERPPLGTWPATQARALNGNRTAALGSRPALDPRSHTSQGLNLIKKSIKKYQQECGETRTIIHCWQTCKIL